MPKNHKKISKMLAVGSMSLAPVLIFTTYELVAQNDKIENHLPYYLRQAVVKQSSEKEIHPISQKEDLSQSPKNIVKSGSQNLMNSHNNGKVVEPKVQFVDTLLAPTLKDAFTTNYNFTTIKKSASDPTISDHDVNHLTTTEENYVRGLNFVSTKLFQDSKGRFWGFARTSATHVVLLSDTNGHLRPTEINAGYDTEAKLEGATFFEDSHGNYWTMGKNHSLRKTTNPNNLNSWTELTSSGVTDGSYGTIYEDSNNRIWVLAPGMPIKYTDDFGEKWEVPHTSNITDGKGSRIIQDTRGWLWTMSKGHSTQYSNDGGATWQEPNASCHVSGENGKFFIDSTGKLWATAKGSPLQYSIDGIFWMSPVHSNIVDGENAMITEGRRGQLFSKGKGTDVQSSTDGGVNWQSGWELLSHSKDVQSNLFVDALGTSWIVSNSSTGSNLQMISDDDRKKNLHLWLSLSSMGSTQLDNDTNIQATPNGDVYFISHNFIRKIRLSENAAIKNNTNLHNVHGTLSIKQKSLIKRESSKYPDHKVPGQIIIEGGDSLQPYAYLEVKRPGATDWEMIRPSAEKKYIIYTTNNGRHYFRFKFFNAEWKLSTASNPANHLPTPFSIDAPLIVSTPTITSKNLKQPTLASAVNGEVTFTLTNYDSRVMRIVNLSHGGNIQTFNSADNTIKINHFTSGEYARIALELKDGSNWPNGATRVLSPKIDFVQTNTGITLPTLTAIKKNPTTTVSPDGSIKFALSNVNTNLNTSTIIFRIFAANGTEKSKLQIAYNSNWNHLPSGTSQQFIGNETTKSMEITKLVNGETATAALVCKTDLTWSDSSTHKDDELSLFTGTSYTKENLKMTQTNTGLAKPTIANTIVKLPTVASSTDGSITYTLTNFDPSTMKITKITSGGTLGQFSGGHVTITGLKNGDYVKIKLSPLSGNNWNDGSITPIQSTSQSIYQSKLGIVKPTFRIVSSVAASSVTANDGKVVVEIVNFDPTTMSASVTSTTSHHESTTHSNNQYTFSNLAIDSTCQITVSLLNTNLGIKWVGNTNTPIKSQIFSVGQSIDKPRIAGSIHGSHTSTSLDGEVTYTLTNFDPSKMDIAKVSGTGGTLGTYDPITHIIKVTGLRSGQTSKIQITPKDGFVWSDNTNSPHLSSEQIFDQTYPGLTRPTITTQSKEKPTIATSHDGKVIFSVEGFDATSMDIRKISSGGTFTFDAAKKIAIISGLTNGDHAQIGIVPKPYLHWTDGVKTVFHAYWTDGTNTEVTSENAEVTQSITALAKPTFTLISKTHASTLTSNDGVLKIRISNFDSKIMTLALVGVPQSSSGSLTTLYDVSTKTFTFPHLSASWKVKVHISFKNSEMVWVGNTKAPVMSDLYAINANATKPQFGATNIKLPTTSSTTNGEATFNITNYDPTKMSISKVAGTDGTLGTYDPVTHSIKVTGLENSDHVQLKITLLENYEWQDNTMDDVQSNNSTIQQSYVGIVKPTATITTKNPTTTSSHDGEMTVQLENYDSTKITIMMSPTSSGILGTYNQSTKTIKITGLSNGETAEIIIKPKNVWDKWEDGTTTQIHLTRQVTTTYVGESVPQVLTTSIPPKTSGSSNGKANFVFNGFAIGKIRIEKAPDSDGGAGIYDQALKVFSIDGLRTGDVAKIQLSLIDPHSTWTDGTKDSKTFEITIGQSLYVGLTKPSISAQVKKPKTSSTHDGEVIFTIDNFDSTKMTIFKTDETLGTLGTYDPVTKTIKVTGLQDGQFAQIQILLNNRIGNPQFWSNGTNTPIMSNKIEVIQTYVGLDKPFVPSPTIHEPSTSTSHDGEVIYKLVGFDPNTMEITKSVISLHGTLGTYDSVSQTIRISGLANGDIAELAITPRGDEFWTDGTLNPVYSDQTTIQQSYSTLEKPTIEWISTKDPSSSTSNDGKVVFRLSGYNQLLMRVIKVSTSPGYLESYDLVDRTISVGGLKYGDKVQIEIMLKPGQMWNDSTSNPVISKVINVGENPESPKFEFDLRDSQKANELAKGVAIFTLNNFDPNSMSVRLSAFSNGQLQEYDELTHTVKVTGINEGELAQVQVWTRPANRGDVPKLLATSQKIVRDQSLIHQTNPTNPPSDSKSTDKSKIIIIAASAVGALLVLPFIWKFGISKFFKAKKRRNNGRW